MEKTKYRLLLENLPDAFAYHQMLTDSRGKALDYVFLDINPAFERMTGLSKKQILGKKISEVYPKVSGLPFDWSKVYGRTPAEKETIRFEQYFEPGGRWYEITAYSVAPGFFAVIFRDITENRRIQSTLKESEENLFITLHSIGDGVIATDLEGKITRMNPQAEKLTGWTFGESSGRPLEEIFRIINTKTGEPAFNPVRHVIKTGETLKLSNDTTLVSRSGKSCQIADSAAPIRDSKGKTSGAVLVFSDVTEQYLARKAQEETARRLEFVLKVTRTGIDIVDGNHDLHYVDHLWQHRYGDPQGRKCYEYFKNRKTPCEDCGVARALKTKEVAVFEQTLPGEGNRTIECHTVPFQNEQGEWLAAMFSVDVTRRRELEEKLRFQLQFERMVGSISSSFLGLETDRIDKMIKRSLRQIGEFFSVDRAVIFQLSPERTMARTHEWCAEGIGPLAGDLKGFTGGSLPWLFTQIQNMAHVYSFDVDELPPEAGAESKEFNRQGIRSFLVLPFSIKSNAHADGFLALDTVRSKKAWTAEQMDLLNIVSEVIGGALSRQRLEEQRNEALTALKESEENLSITLHSIDDGVIATDTGGRIKRMNLKAEKLTGWTLEEAAGRPIGEVFNMINIKTGGPAFNPVAHVIKTGKVAGLANDTALVARDGSVRQISDSAAPIRDSKGNTSGVVMVFSDVTEQYNARQALQESESRYRTIVENINDGLIIFDFQLKITDLNETACRMLGYEQGELPGASLAAITSKEDQKKAPRFMEQLLTNNQFLFEGKLLRKDGTPVPVESSLKIVSREGHGLIQAFVRDITERKLDEQKIADYTAELEKLYLELGEEMNKAREVHRRTLPKKFPAIKGLSLAAHYQPAKKLGGDFYDVAHLGKKIVLYLSDVTGHGVDGALLSLFVKHTIRGYLFFSPEEHIGPEKILRYLSDQFHLKNLSAEYFISIFLAVLDLETMVLTYTAAGFQDTPLVSLGSGKQLRLISKGLFLSPAFSDELLNLQESSLHLTPGTTILFNTDGLTEQGVKGVYYGTHLPAVFYKNSSLPPELIVQTICEDFRSFNNGSLQGDDDITFLVMQVDPESRITERLELASDFAELKHLREKIASVLGCCKEAELFLTCLHEVASNAMEHGNKLDREKTVSIEMVVTNRFILANVEDRGGGFDWREYINRPIELNGLSERGRGIALARECCDHFYYNDKGNRATLVIELKGANGHGN